MQWKQKRRDIPFSQGSKGYELVSTPESVYAVRPLARGLRLSTLYA